jgi:hypothetical protein
MTARPSLTSWSRPSPGSMPRRASSQETSHEEAPHAVVPGPPVARREPR